MARRNQCKGIHVCSNVAENFNADAWKVFRVNAII